MTRQRYIAHFFLHGDIAEERYTQVLELLAGITPSVQPIGPDAVQVDLTGAIRFFDRDPFEILQLARMRLTAHLGIKTSGGLGPNRMIAAMACAVSPPGRATHVPGGPDQAAQWLRPRPVAALPGVGKATATLLDRYGLRTIGQVADLPPATLQRILGAAPARLLAERARGRDPQPVSAQAPAEHVSADRILQRDCLDAADHHRAVLALAEEIGVRLRSARQVTGRLTLTVRYTDRSASTRTRSLPEPTAHSPALAAAARGMLDSLALQRARVRAYAVRADLLADQDTAHHQLSMDPVDGRARAAEAAADRARGRFGTEAIRPATLAGHPGKDR